MTQDVTPASADPSSAASREGRVFLSVITIHEIEKGLHCSNTKERRRRAAGHKAWLAGLVATYDDKIIGLDAAAAAFAGQLEAKAISGGCDPGMANAAIAGIAKVHDLIVVTRKTKHSLPFDVHAATPEEAVNISLD
jgi:predicted nucleic acid-binding protein